MILIIISHSTHVDWPAWWRLSPSLPLIYWMKSGLIECGSYDKI